MTSVPSDSRPAPARRRLARATCVIALLVGLGIGFIVSWGVFAATRPDDGDLQRAALDEVGLAPELESAPIIGPIIDEVTDRVAARVIDETRTSVVWSAAAGVVVAVVCCLGVIHLIDRSHRLPRGES